MVRFFLVLCALYAGSAVAAAVPPSAAQDAVPVHQERNLSERAGAVTGRAAEETTSAFGARAVMHRAAIGRRRAIDRAPGRNDRDRAVGKCAGARIGALNAFTPVLVA